MTEGFPHDALVILHLVNPKEKFWGHLISMTPIGVTLRGINLDTFEDWIRQVVHRERDEQTLDLVTMFVPLFRVERIFLDESVGAVHSYSDYFAETVGRSPQSWLGLDEEETSA